MPGGCSGCSISSRRGWRTTCRSRDLAAEACLSPFHFSRLFRDATGLSPHRYVIERRIRAAQKMLSSTQSPLVDVALETGFGSQATFTRAFRQVTGVTPSQFRDPSR